MRRILIDVLDDSLRIDRVLQEALKKCDNEDLKIQIREAIDIQDTFYRFILNTLNQV